MIHHVFIVKVLEGFWSIFILLDAVVYETLFLISSLFISLFIEILIYCRTQLLFFTLFWSFMFNIFFIFTWGKFYFLLFSLNVLALESVVLRISPGLWSWKTRFVLSYMLLMAKGKRTFNPHCTLLILFTNNWVLY